VGKLHGNSLKPSYGKPSLKILLVTDSVDPKKALNRYLKSLLRGFLPIEERRTLLIEVKMNFFLTVQHRYQQNPLQPENRR
jgi:hypothetical protein